MARRKRERIVEQAREWFSDPENFGKTLRECAEALGITYDSLKKAIYRYGRRRFWAEVLEIYRETRQPVVEEARNALIRWAHEKATDPHADASEKMKAHQIISKEIDVVEGTRVRHELGDEERELFRVLLEIRERRINQRDS